jgi:hypothetical protein
MQIKQIFLASSSELRDDREAFQRMIAQLNEDWILKGFFFKLVIWEDFIDAMSKDGLQQEYNKAVRDCDIFVLLFKKKVGAFTAEEFEAAFGAMQSNGRPRIYTYFKDTLVLTGEIDDSIISMLDFKKKLRSLNHYVTRYTSAEDLMWQFSRQLGKLYGQDQGLAFQITDRTPQSQIDSIALTLVNRALSDIDAGTTVDADRLHTAIVRATDLARYTILILAQTVRNENWANNKSLMERTIPIFRALTEADPHNHFALGQLGYALKDQVPPDWQAAKDALDRAIELRGPGDVGWPFYEFNRAMCAIRLDPGFEQSRRATPARRKAIVEDLKTARRGLDRFDELISQPQNRFITQWLQLNGVRSLA